VVPGSVNTVKTDSQTLATTLASTGASGAAVKDLTSAFAGFAPNAAKVEIVKGKTADGTPRVLLASLNEGQNKQSFWWFAPPSQPEGWFDEEGRRLGDTGLSEPRPGARISSPFGTRGYYGRRSSGAFHDGIDFESKVGDPILAAGDGVINHQGWYFEYGRTVKISHTDNLETLYAHMSRFAEGMGPGSHVHKGDLIGYVGMTGRSTGPHLHFSVIVSGRFVDPQPYLSGKGIDSTLTGDNLVAYRAWQTEIRKAINSSQSGFRRFFGLQDAEPWSSNPFTSAPTLDRL
jgi:murein DD-endopeptidase MepM/ murein hydrolase activator NlpD